MFKKLNLSIQLNVAFGAILLLLIVISLVSYNGLNQSYKNFMAYRELAKTANLAGQVQENMLLMRLAVLEFVNTGSEASVSDFNERQQTMEVLLDDAVSEITQAERAELVASAKGEVGDYVNGFNQIVASFNERKLAIDERLNPAGIEMREALVDMVDSAYDEDDTETTYLIGRLQQHLLMANLYVAKFLANNHPEDAERVRLELDKYIPKKIKDLDSQLESAMRRQQLFVVRSTYKKYQETFTELEEIIA